MASSPVTVRIAFWPYWLSIFLPCCLIGTLVHYVMLHALSDVWMTWIEYGVSLGFVLEVVAVFTIVATWVYQRQITVRISAAEIKGFDVLGLPATFPWNEVDKLKPIHWLGLKILRIYSKKHYWALWMPLEIANPSATRALIASLEGKPRELLPFLEKT